MIKNIFHLNKFKIRLMYWISVILMMIFVVCPMFFFFYLFDEDRVKQMLYSEFDNNDYNVVVNGAITPRFWHGLSLEVDDLVVATNKDIELLHIKKADCQLSWIDLVFAHYKIKQISLNDVEVFQKNISDYGLDNLLSMPSMGKSAFNHLENISIYDINSVDTNISYPIKVALST